MKIRLSHVTNSSSSSFIISRDQIKRKKLIKILLEIANKEYYYYDEYYYDNESNNAEPYFTLEDDVTEDCVAGRYHIKKATKKHPLDNDGYVWNKYSDSEPYDHHWIIYNDDCGRYDWNAVEKVLDKYGIEWQRGYCD